MAALWPNVEAVIGVYEAPPPEGGPVDAIAIDRSSPAFSDFYSAQGVKTGLALSRAKDWIRGHLP